MKTSRLLRIGAVLAAAGAYVVITNSMELRRIAIPLPAAGAAQSTVDSTRLLADVRTLSSVEFGGRRTGSDGSRKAQAFLHGRFEELGKRGTNQTASMRRRGAKFFIRATPSFRVFS